jgi:hypothetical protein
MGLWLLRFILMNRSPASGFPRQTCPKGVNLCLPLEYKGAGGIKKQNDTEDAFGLFLIPYKRLCVAPGSFSYPPTPMGRPFPDAFSDSSQFLNLPSLLRNKAGLQETHPYCKWGPHPRPPFILSRLLGADFSALPWFSQPSPLAFLRMSRSELFPVGGRMVNCRKDGGRLEFQLGRDYI